jgi:D-alanyl-lipoteichoic acid acyltransferase DltB (MBOAT superfamily)
MQRGYFAADVHAMQERGLQMMFRGTVHLLCYRLVYHELLISPTKVHDWASLGVYLVCNYLLYLQVSGQFHMACGMLHLFGFQLPETHHRYLLATSFTDYWRRINIYWKDFMIRIFFNPVVFRLKRWPQRAALAVATITVFLATWLLHAYQSYWLRGTWGFTLQDALFWGILGALVLVNVQLDLRRVRPSGSHHRTATPTPRELAVRAVKIAGTFTTVALLWSLWSSPSLSAWLDLLRRGFYGS